MILDFRAHAGLSQSKSQSSARRVVPSSTFYYLLCSRVTEPVDASSVLFLHMPTATAGGVMSIVMIYSMFQYHMSPLPMASCMLQGMLVCSSSVVSQERRLFFSVLKVHINVLSINLLCGCGWKVSQLKKWLCSVQGPGLWHFSTLFRSRAFI